MNENKHQKEKYNIYRMLTKNGYNLNSDISNPFLEMLIAKMGECTLKLEDNKLNYDTKELNNHEIFKLVGDFFSKIYANKNIINEISLLLDRASFSYIDNYQEANAMLERKYNLENPEILNFNIDYYNDILTSSLIVHELSHALYLPSSKYLYNEVLSMTLERIFGNLYHKELNILQSKKAIESSAFIEDDYNNIYFRKSRNKIIASETFFNKIYLIGYISSLYLTECYLDNPKGFREQLVKHRNDYDFAEKILYYYGIKIDSIKSINIIDEDIEKVLKKMSNN